jgi:hypothetical protein
MGGERKIYMSLRAPLLMSRDVTKDSWGTLMGGGTRLYFASRRLGGVKGGEVRTNFVLGGYGQIGCGFQCPSVFFNDVVLAFVVDSFLAISMKPPILSHPSTTPQPPLLSRESIQDPTRVTRAQKILSILQSSCATTNHRCLLRTCP